MHIAAAQTFVKAVKLAPKCLVCNKRLSLMAGYKVEPGTYKSPWRIVTNSSACKHLVHVSCQIRCEKASGKCFVCPCGARARQPTMHMFAVKKKKEEKLEKKKKKKKKKVALPSPQL